MKCQVLVHHSGLFGVSAAPFTLQSFKEGMSLLVARRNKREHQMQLNDSVCCQQLCHLGQFYELQSCQIYLV